MLNEGESDVSQALGTKHQFDLNRFCSQLCGITQQICRGCSQDSVANIPRFVATEVSVSGGDVTGSPRANSDHAFKNVIPELPSHT